MGFSRRISRFNNTAYRAWHRILFRLQAIIKAPRYPKQTIFIHVPKTAGLSIHEYFASFIGSRRSRRYAYIDKFYGEAYNENASDEALKEARSALLVAGHIDWKLVMSVRQPHAFVFTILRDPAERLLSNYHYLHRMSEDGLFVQRRLSVIRKLKSLSFEEFCTSNDPEILYTTNNLMVRQLSYRINGTADLDAPFGEMLDEALKNIAAMDYVGFQQTLKHDFHDLVKKMGFPVLPLPKKNVTKELGKNYGPSYNPVVNKEDLLGLAAPRLQWDIALYQQALTLAPEINRKPFIRE